MIGSLSCVLMRDSAGLAWAAARIPARERNNCRWRWFALLLAGHAITPDEGWGIPIPDWTSPGRNGRPTSNWHDRHCAKTEWPAVRAQNSFRCSNATGMISSRPNRPPDGQSGLKALPFSPSEPHAGTLWSWNRLAGQSPSIARSRTSLGLSGRPWTQTSVQRVLSNSSRKPSYSYRRIAMTVSINRILPGLLLALFLSAADVNTFSIVANSSAREVIDKLLPADTFPGKDDRQVAGIDKQADVVSFTVPGIL